MMKTLGRNSDHLTTAQANQSHCCLKQRARSSTLSLQYLTLAVTTDPSKLRRQLNAQLARVISDERHFNFNRKIVSECAGKV